MNTEQTPGFNTRKLIRNILIVIVLEYLNAISLIGLTDYLRNNDTPISIISRVNYGFLIVLDFIIFINIFCLIMFIIKTPNHYKIIKK